MLQEVAEWDVFLVIPYIVAVVRITDVTRSGGSIYITDRDETYREQKRHAF